MDRVALLEKLELVAPALSDGNLIPILSHFWFTGDHLMAYNDRIGISTPLTTDFYGAVPGGTLVSLLKASRAKRVDILSDKKHLTIKAAGAKLKLPLLPPDSFIFDMPKKPKGGTLADKTKEALVDSLETCLMSVGNDTSVPDHLGVTIIPNGDATHLFTTNFATMTHAKVKASLGEHRVILHKDFVQQVIKLSKNAKAVSLTIKPDHALFVAEHDDGETIVFGRLVETGNPIDFERMLKDHMPDKFEKLLTPIPSKMKLILDRAVIICDSKIDQAKTQITVKDGDVTFESRSDRGEVRDVMEADKKQQDVSLIIEAKLLRNGCDDFDDYVLHKNCAIMTRGSAIYMVAAMSGKKHDAGDPALDDDIPF